MLYFSLCNVYYIYILGVPTAIETCEWTGWIDMDNPAGMGDFESLSNALNKYIPKCDAVSMEAREVNTHIAVENITDVHFQTNTPLVGLFCVQNDQNKQLCGDYETRYCCLRGKAIISFKIIYMHVMQHKFNHRGH